MVKLNRKKEVEKIDYKGAIIAISALLIIIAVSVFVIFKLSTKEKLYGTWNLVTVTQNNNTENVKYDYQITFFEDNTLTITDNKDTKQKAIVTNYKYEIEKKNITITLEDEEVENDISGTYKVKVNGNKVTLSNDDISMKFTKNKGY